MKQRVEMVNVYPNRACVMVDETVMMDLMKTHAVQCPQTVIEYLIEILSLNYCYLLKYASLTKEYAVEPASVYKRSGGVTESQTVMTAKMSDRAVIEFL